MLENVPLSQALHVVQLLAPVALEYVPAGHGVHAGWNPVSEYVPGGQYFEGSILQVMSDVELQGLSIISHEF